MKICCQSMQNIQIFQNALNSRYIRHWNLYTKTTIQINIIPRINSYFILVKHYQNIIYANRKIPFERESVKPSHQTLASEVQSLEMTEVKYRWHLINLCWCILCFQSSCCNDFQSVSPPGHNWLQLWDGSIFIRASGLSSWMNVTIWT